jgi:hypothetical protein
VNGRLQEAKARPYIPAEIKGFDPKWDLSASPRYPIHLIDDITPVSINLLPDRISELVKKRAEMYGVHRRSVRSRLLRPAAIAPKSEILMKFAVAPLLQEKVKQSNDNALFVNDYGYPMPFWPQTALGAPIKEYDFDTAIRNGEHLPQEISAVYLDYPRTYGKKAPPPEALKRFIINNPNVLFIIDQANTGFADNTQQFLSNALSELEFQVELPDAAIIVTNSTSKNIATGVAWAYVSDKAKGLVFEYSDKTKFFGFDDYLTINKALQVLDHEDQAQAWRLLLVQNRNILAAMLPAKALPFGEGSNPHLIIDARVLGYADAKDMVKTFSAGFPNEGIPPIAIKTCEPYADPEKYPEILNHVFISIPVDVEVMKALQQVLKGILDKNSN